MQNPGSSSTATLSPGTRLGRYEITGFVASGGMGEVYRAKDSSLNRDIAIKVLPANVAADAERRARFEREARMAAGLNHPGIVTIHSVEQDGDRVFITMELVQGKLLADLIPHNGLPLARLLSIAVPLANAVSAAHDKGITHRDLKPANVMVVNDDAVKVLDFGIAKRHDVDASSDLATATTSFATAEGRLVGTIAYMSPEQAEGKPADQRSDVFSLGTMLYEMATGRRPFAADSDLATLAAIVRDTPAPITEVNPRVPRELSRIIRRALAKDPDRRQQSAKDLRNELDDLRRDLESGELASAAVTPPRRGATVWVLGAAGIIAAISAVAFWPRDDAPSDPVAGAAPLAGITMTEVTAEDGLELFPSLSPDGKWVVYTRDEQGTGQTDILLRAVGGLTAINLTRDSTADDLSPVFSPDGERIVFRSERDGGGLFVMGRTGESVRRLTSQGFNPSWSPDGSSIVYGTESITTNPGARVTISALWTVSLTTGESRQLTAGGDAVQPSWSPHGQRIAYWAISGDRSQRDIWSIAANGGQPVRVMDDAAIDWNPVWSPDGRYLYFSSNRSGGYGLWRVAIDEASGRRIAEPEAVPLTRAGVAHFSFGGGGTFLAMSSLAFQRNLEGVAFDVRTLKAGSRRRITNNSETGVIALTADAPSASADGQWLAFVPAAFQPDVWVVKTDGTGLRQLTDDTPRDNNPNWFPDGRQLLFRTERNNRFQAWTMNADGGNLKQVTDVPGAVQWLALSPDGRRAITSVLGETTTTLMFDPHVDAGQQRVEELPRPKDTNFYPTSWSPDGLRIAGVVGAGDRIAVYSVAAREYQQFAAVGSRPTWPAWLPDSRTLLYTTSRELLSLDTATNVSRVISRFPAEFISGPALSPDERTLYLNIIKPQGDIVIARVGNGTF
jgi:serine/threonine protein kinase